MDDRVDLVFIPSIGLSHIIPTVEVAKLLIQRNHRFTATFFIIPAPLNRSNPTVYIDSVTNSFPRIRFIFLQPADLPPPGTEPGFAFLTIYIQNHQPFVKQAMTQLISDSKTTNSVRLVVDMFTTCMIDSAHELGIPSYLYFTSGAASLGFVLLLPDLDSDMSANYSTESTQLVIPSYANPLPTHSLPSYFLDKTSTSYSWAVSAARRFKEMKGIIVNSFAELEPQAVRAFDGLIGGIPRVYLVGPLLDLEGKTHSGANSTQHNRIKKWLDDQPPSSVIFLCFGTRGSMSAPQVREIAYGLERSGHRFLWSLRRQPDSKMEAPTEYTNHEEVLPDGFLERVGERGLICGWAPQVDVLAHKSIGGFVSHCGWNSILESAWFGVPILTWPLDAEQKQNAFQLVKDLGLAVDVRSEEYYKREEGNMVVAEEVEEGVKCVMESKSEVRRKMKEMSAKCRKVLMDGGSSLSALDHLVREFTKQF